MIKSMNAHNAAELTSVISFLIEADFAQRYSNRSLFDENLDLEECT